MKTRIVPIVLGLLVVSAVALLGSLGWHFYRTATKPILKRDGGTILVYAVEPADVPAYQPADLVAALQKRVDPSGVANISVRALDDGQVEIAIPHDAGHVERVELVKDLIRQGGQLEFRILANARDDKAAQEVAREVLEGAAAETPALTAARHRALNEAATRGMPPPPPGNAGMAGEYTWSNEHDSGEATYAWVELARAERRSCDLDNKAADDINRNRRWVEAAAARDGGRALLLTDRGQTLLYSRICRDDRRSPSEREAKRFEYFYLTRVPPPKQAVTGRDLDSVEPQVDSRMQPSVGFRFSASAGDRFHDFTAQNRPSGGANDRFHRHLAIILDGEVVSAPRLNGAIRADGQISGNFSLEEVEAMARILRAGALPVRLKQFPIREEVVQPAGR